MQPLVAGHATIPHLKAMDVPFHLVYGSLICFKGLQSDRPKCRASLVDPGEYQTHAEDGLFVPGLIYTYLLEKYNIFIPSDSSRSPLSNEIWLDYLLQEVTE